MVEVTRFRTAQLFSPLAKNLLGMSFPLEAENLFEAPFRFAVVKNVVLGAYTHFIKTVSGVCLLHCSIFWSPAAAFSGAIRFPPQFVTEQAPEP